MKDAVDYYHNQTTSLSVEKPTTHPRALIDARLLNELELSPSLLRQINQIKSNGESDKQRQSRLKRENKKQQKQSKKQQHHQQQKPKTTKTTTRTMKKIIPVHFSYEKNNDIRYNEVCF